MDKLSDEKESFELEKEEFQNHSRIFEVNRYTKAEFESILSKLEESERIQHELQSQ